MFINFGLGAAEKGKGGGKKGKLKQWKINFIV